MSQTVTIDIINKKALPLLRDLEDLNLIRLHDVSSNQDEKKTKRSYKGAMTQQTIQEVEDQLRELRNEWN
nr:hypothetical protein [uncultured Dyadobacter sp.]